MGSSAMGTICFGLSGEGRGHATRAQVLIEALKEQHRLVVCTYGDAWEMLSRIYARSDVEIRRLPGLRFRYDREGRLDHTATALFAAPYLARLPERVLLWSRELERAGADLVISDFEPLLPRAARQAGVPHRSVDHQHFLVAYDLSSLRPELRLRAELLAQAGAAVLLGSEAHDRFGLLLSVAQGSAGGGHARWRSLAA